MADKWPLANGNWSNAANWNDGTKPQADDDVYADGKTVTIDQDVTVKSLTRNQRSGGTVGGYFVCSTTRTIIANLVGVRWTAHNVPVLSVTGAFPNIVNIIGNLTPGTSYGTSNSDAAVTNSGSGTVRITGSVLPGNNACVVNSSSGMIEITGEVTGGVHHVYAPTYGVLNSGSGTVTITGAVTGGTGGMACGAANTGTGSISITGAVTGATGGGALNSSTGTVTITGNVTAGSDATGGFGAKNSSTGILIVVGTITATTAPGAVNLLATGRLRHSGGNVVCGANGTCGISAANLLIADTAVLVHSYRVDQSGSPGPDRSLYTGGQNLGQPSAADVRYGTTFGVSSEYTGTCHIPGAASVLSGVPVDATVGTATIDAASIRAAVGLASANLDAQFSAIEVNPQSIRDAMKLAPSAGAAAANSIDSKVEDRATPAAVAALLAAALDAP